jgi:hypothetical protein
MNFFQASTCNNQTLLCEKVGRRSIQLSLHTIRLVNQITLQALTEVFKEWYIPGHYNIAHRIKLM